MSLASQMADDVESVFLNTEDFAVSVIYQRGTLTVTLDAVVSQSVFESGTDYGVMRVETRDYLFKPSALVLNAKTITPERGDKIIEDGRTHIVTEPAGLPAYVYDDENRLMMRVHSVLSKES